MESNKEIKILSPLRDIEEVEPLIKAGANEFYCGIHPDPSPKTYESYFSNLDKIKEAVKIAHKHKAKVFLILNKNYYTEDQYFNIIKEIKELKKIGHDAFIISNLPLLLILKEKKINIEIHLSTLAGVFNSKAIQFFKNLGVSRIILPYDLLLKEIEQLAKDKEIEFEVFVKNSHCLNTISLCTFKPIRDPSFSRTNIHFSYKYPLMRKIYDNWFKKLPNNFIECLAKFGPTKKYLNSPVLFPCRLNYDVSFFKRSGKYFEDRIYKSIKKNFSHSQRIKKEFLCGACAMEHLYNLNIRFFKIEGRAHPLERKIKDVKFIKSLTDILEKKEKMQQKINFYSFAKKKYKEIYGRNCKESSCYHPYELW